MRHPRVVVAAIFILVLGIASAVAFNLAASEERAPESLLPADSVVYFGWDGTEKHKTAWEKTACYESLDKTHILKTLADFGVSFIPPDSDIPSEAISQLLEGIGRRGISASVSFPKERQLPRVLAVLHHAASLEPAFTAAIPKIVDRMSSSPTPANGVLGSPDAVVHRESRFETLSIRGRKVTRGTFAGSPGMEFAWWADGGHLVLVYGEGAVDAALDVADGKSPPITQSANWHKYRDEPKDRPAIVAAWCDVAALRARHGDIVIWDKSRKKATVRDVIDRAGGERLACLAMRCALKDRAIVSDFTIDAPAPRTGLMALADQAPIKLGDLPPLPAGNTGVGVVSFNWSKAYDVIVGTIKNVLDGDPKSLAGVDEFLRKMPDVLGCDPKSDLCDALGHVVCFHSDSAAGIPGGLGFGIALSVEKPYWLGKTLKKGFEKLQAALPQGFAVAEEERLGRPTWVFDIVNMPFHPTVALDKHWLFIALTPQSAEASLMRVDGKLGRWKPTAEEQEALNFAPKEFISLTLSDPRALYGTAVTYLPVLASTLNQAEAESRPARRGGAPRAPNRASGKRMALLADIPPAEVLTRPMFPNVGFATVDANGVRYRSRDSVPGLSTGGFLAVPVAVALLLPAVQAAREAARRAQSRNNVKQIGLALYLYHDAHGSFPAGTHLNAALKPDKRLSWMTKILPYVELKPAHDMIDFKKSWDDPENRKAVDLPLSLFINPTVGPQKANGLPVTEYVGMAGVGADGPTLPVTSPRAGVFACDRVTRLADIKDGTSTTIMISECNKDLGPWAAGGRATIRSLTKQPYIDGPDGLGGHPEGCQVGFADGSVRFISKHIDAKTLEALMSINGHEPIRLPGQ
jgi:prepilin-type processing-associated H-X9-DG protein